VSLEVSRGWLSHRTPHVMSHRVLVAPPMNNVETYLTVNFL